MNLNDFLGTVLPTSGTYIVAHHRVGEPMYHKAVPDLSAAVKLLHKYKLKNWDAYFAVASFTGTNRKRGQVSKKVCWYVDVDCKPDGSGQYATKSLAAQALKQAIKNGLPVPSLVVDSGRGLHLYWVCTIEVSEDAWQPIADWFAVACPQHGLEIDKGVGVDSVRLLRAPETMNVKDKENPKPCRVVSATNARYTLEELQERAGAGPAEPEIQAKPNLTAVPGGKQDVDDLGGEVSTGPAPAKGMLEGCQLMANNLATQGRDTPGEIWHKIIHTLAFTSDGHDYIHEISRAHDTYTPHGTEARWNHAVAGLSRPGMGATLCKTFQACGATECATCPIKDEGRSPIVFSFRQSHDPELPYPFRNGPRGLEMYDDDAEDFVQVLDRQVTDLEAALDYGEGTVIACKIGGRVLRFELSDVVTYQTFAATASRYGFHFYKSQVEVLQRLVHNFLKQLEDNRKLRQSVKAYGWVKGGGFHAGGVVFNATGKTAAAVHIEEHVAEQYTPTGDVAVWSDCANFILKQDRPSAWTVLASAFAAPLTRFTGASGALLSIVSSGSGTGKTTLLKAAQAVWGHPKEGIAHLNDTPNSVANRLTILQNLPSYWDEVRGKDDMADFVKMVFRLGQGKEKQRLTSSIRQRKTGTWETMMVTATNEPIRDHVSHAVGNSNAGYARVFEIRAPEIVADGMNDGVARAFYDRLSKNYGGVGQLYAELLASKAEKIEEAVQAMDSAICQKFNTTGDERYWVAIIATLLVGAKLANSLGVAKFPMPTFQKYLFDQFAAHRRLMREEFSSGPKRSLRYIRQFIQAQAESTCQAYFVPRRGNPSSSNRLTVEARRYPATVRICHKDKLIRINEKAFRDWLYAEYGGAFSEVIEDLCAMGAVRIRGVLDAGSAHSSHIRDKCIDIPLKGAYADIYVYSGDDDPSDLAGEI